MKGNLAIGQSGGPTPVINATLAGIIRAARNSACFDGIVGLRHGMEGALKADFIDLDALTDADLITLAHTPGAALGSSRHVLAEADYTQLLDNFRARDIRAFAYIGGNGSMWVANHIAECAAEAGYELQVIGVPKTIDNDLPCTDHAPGYGSAARFIALAARDAGLDLEAMQTFDDVVIIESMGRDAGWLAAASGLLKASADEAPHLIYVPEIPFDEAQFLADVAGVHARLGRCLVVVSEGIRTAEGQFVGRPTDGSDRDALGRLIHGLSAGPAAYLITRVRDGLQLQSRFYRPGLIGRAFTACISEVDRLEAYFVGESGAQLLAEGQSGLMVTLESPPSLPLFRSGIVSPPLYSMERGSGGEVNISTVPLAQVAAAQKPLPRDYMNAAGNMITDAFRDYALPLIGAVPPIIRLNKGNL